MSDRAATAENTATANFFMEPPGFPFGVQMCHDSGQVSIFLLGTTLFALSGCRPETRATGDSTTTQQTPVVASLPDSTVPAGRPDPMNLGLATTLSEASAPRDTIRSLPDDSAVVTVVRPAGAVIEFPQVVRVRFAAGAFATPETVSVRISSLPSTERGLEYYDLGDGGRPPFLAKDVTVRGRVEPRHGFQVEFVLPDSTLECSPEDRWFRVFQEFTGGGDMEALVMYEPLASTRDTAARTISGHVGLPPVEQGPGLHEVLHVACFHR